jgi:hypothetical protein
MEHDSPAATNRIHGSGSISINRTPFDHNAILCALQADFEKEGKHTVHECLRSRRGVLHPKVAAFLEKNDTKNQHHGLVVPLDQLSAAHNLLLEGEAYSMDAFPNPSVNIHHSASSLGYLSRIATVVRFLQLLLESSNRTNVRPLSERPGGCNNNAGSSSTISFAHAVQPQIDKMVSILLQKLSRSICNGMKKWKEKKITRLETTTSITTEDMEMDDNPMTSDASTTFDMRHLACFAFSSLVKLNFYAKSRITLVATLWKVLCDIASSSCCPSTTARVDLAGHSLLSLELVEEAITALSSYLLEGEEQVRLYSAQFVVSRSSPVSVQQQAGQAKLLTFLVTRMTVLLQAAACHSTAVATITDRNEGYSTTKEHVIDALLRLHGLATTVELLVIDSSRTMAACSTKVSGFLQPYSDLSKKLERCFVSLMTTTSLDIGESAEKQVLLRRAMIDTVLESASDYVIVASPPTKDVLSQLSLALGRTMVLQLVLVTVVEQGTSLLYSEEDVELILLVCEHLVCSCLPQCHAPLMLAAISAGDDDSGKPPVSTEVVVSLLSMTVEMISTIIARLESTAPTMDALKRAKLHRLLIRWLAPPAISGKVQHPLQRELAISLLYLHIRVQMDDSSKGNKFIEPIVSMLSKLLFDPRTGRVLRENIAAVIMRLLGPTAEGRIRELMAKHVTDEWSLRNQKSKKRKRDATGDKSCNYEQYLAHEQRAIGSVLSKLPEVTPACPKLLKMLPKLGLQAERLLSLKKGWNESTAASTESTALILSLTTGLFGNTSTKDDTAAPFHDAFGQSDVARLHRMTMVWPRTLCQWSSATRGGSSKEVALLGAVLRFFRCACSAFGRFGKSEIPIQVICDLLALCTKPLDRLSQDRESVYRRFVSFEAIGLLGSLAKAIPPSCPERILKVS